MSLWDNFTYCIKLEFYFPEEQKTETYFVTEVCYSPKTFRYKRTSEVKENNIKIPTFKIEQAVDLMNSMYCNGYKASIEPYFD